MRIDFDEENLSDAGRFPSLTLYGNIDIDEAQKRIDTKLRIKKVMSAHNHPVYHSEKSGWFTDVDDPARPNGLRKS